MMHLAVVGMVMAMAMAQVTLASPASAPSSLSTHSAFEEITDAGRRALQTRHYRVEEVQVYEPPPNPIEVWAEKLKFWVPVVCLSLGLASALYDCYAKGQGGQRQGRQRQGGPHIELTSVSSADFDHVNQRLGIEAGDSIYASDATSSNNLIRSDPVGASSYVPPVVNQEQDASLLAPEVKSLAATLEEAQLSQYESALREFKTFLSPYIRSVAS